MSEELRDFRGKLTTRAHVALEAESRKTGRERQEIVRDILDKWAADEIHGASLLMRLALAEGLIGESEGMSGSRRK